MQKATFDEARFRRGHTPVYSKSEMRRFNYDFDKQLTFNFLQR